MKIGVSWLDLRLSFRMLVKYPGLTLVGRLAIAFATGGGATGFESYTQVMHPMLPLEEGERIVGVQNWDRLEREPGRTTLHDVASWREEVKSLEGLGAFRALERNPITGEGRAGPVAGAP